MIIVRGGGDIATGVIQKLHRSGYKVLVLETEKPSAIRREVALCEAVYDEKKVVEDITAVLVRHHDELDKIWHSGFVPIMVDEEGKVISSLKPKVIVDAILAKKNLGTYKHMAPITIGLGPGFKAGYDVHIVIETMRGHNLGRLIFIGSAIENTGVPGLISGHGKKRVIHSPQDGIIHLVKGIGDKVYEGDVVATVNDVLVKATISGVLRGVIRDNTYVKHKMKIADIDPRIEEKENCYTISDKARNIGGAVLEAILYMENKLKQSGNQNG